jgi:hypothetical protein
MVDYLYLLELGVWRLHGGGDGGCRKLEVLGGTVHLYLVEGRPAHQLLLLFVIMKMDLLVNQPPWYPRQDLIVPSIPLELLVLLLLPLLDLIELPSLPLH